MKYYICLIILFLANVLCAQNIELKEARFRPGDHADWKELSLDDSSWKKVTMGDERKEDFASYDGVGWYRFRFTLPQALRDKSVLKEKLRVVLNKIDDNEVTYWNGVKIGSTEGYNSDRSYLVNANSSFLKWDGVNILAVRVEDLDGPGGLYGGIPFINMMDLIDFLKVTLDVSPHHSRLVLSCSAEKEIAGDLSVDVVSTEKKKVIKSYNQNYRLSMGQQILIPLVKDLEGRHRIDVVVRESQTGKSIQKSAIIPYILTPKDSKKPRINGAKVFGVRVGSPVLYRVAATGQPPLTFAVKNLPKELKLDAKTGIITGVLKNKKKYKMEVSAKNSLGTASREFTIVVGESIALTPPMGWNSWNCWGLSVTEDKVKASAEAMLDKLVGHGWSYINIDDGWQEEFRDRANGNILVNKKFTDMKALGEWLHKEGLKFGIYSSPGERTCGNFLGSLGHEESDAKSYADWGIDYLKYDWCSYSKVAGKNTDLATLQKPYITMRDALAKQNRDIVYSLCQYGMGNVWEWGDQVNGNCWRTTGDIEDSWASVLGIGFSQTVQYKYAKPGRWNDPDMLSVGKVGWGENLRATRLTCEEQYTHISLWCLLNSPLLIGCDMSQLDDFTLNLLTNDEVLAVNQDVLGIQASPKIKKPAYQVWMKEMEDGHAIGIFNTSEEDDTLTINWSELGFSKPKLSARDLWRQKDLGSFETSFSTFVPGHGVVLIKVAK